MMTCMNPFIDMILQEYVDSIAMDLPELPDETRTRIMKQYSMSLDDANSLLNEPGSLEFFEKVRNAIVRNELADALKWIDQVCKGRNSQIVLNW